MKTINKIIILFFSMLFCCHVDIWAQTSKYEMVVEKTDGTELVFFITGDYPILKYQYGGDEGINKLIITTENGSTSVLCPEVKKVSSKSEYYYSFKYTIDDIVYKEDSIPCGRSIIAEPTPTREGYTFSGWSEIPTVMPANDVEIVGSFSINSYNLVYKVDGLDYKSSVIEYGSTITAEETPTKEGYTFSGWSEIPTVMPANDVEVTGSFTVNKYLLSVLIDGVVEYSDSIVYGTGLADYVDLITQQGIDISQWEWYDKIDTITMPAHDVIINAVLNAVTPAVSEEKNDVIYDLIGRKIKVDEMSTLPPGIYIRNGRKIVIR